MQDDTRETLRDQVTRLMTFLADLVRSRSGDVHDISDHPGHVWVGPSTAVAVRSNAVPGQVVVARAVRMTSLRSGAAGADWCSPSGW